MATQNTGTALEGSDLEKQSAAVDADRLRLSSQVADSSQADITNEDLFPGMDQKINVGSSTSQTLGTQPIFVAAGQYVPYNILNKKEEAIAVASKKRAARQAKFDPGKAGKLNNQLYQGQLNKRFNEMNSDVISTAQSMYPDNWDVALNDPGTEIGKIYAQQKSTFEVLATESNVTFDRTAQVIKDKETGGPTLYSKASRDLAYQIKNKTEAFANGSLEDLRPLVDEFNGSFDLDKHLADNSVVSQMKADITSLITPEHGGLTTQEIHDFSARIEAYAESETANESGRYYDDDIIKKQDIIDRLSSMLGTDEGKTHKFSPSVPARVDKKQEAADRLKLRVRNLQKARNNPKGDIGRTVIQGSVGSSFKGGTIKTAKTLDPSDWEKAETEHFNPLIAKINGQRDKYDAEPGHWKKDVIKETKQLIRDAGVSGLVKVTYDGDDESNIFNITIGTEKITLDVDNEDSVKDFEDAFMTSVYGGSDFKDKSVVVLDVANSKGEVTQTERLGVDDPEWVAVTNSVLNKNAGQDKEVETDQVLDAMGEGNTGGSKLTKNQIRIDKDAAIKAKKEAKELKVKYPKATDANIASFIKNKATPEQIEAFLKQKNSK